MRKDGGDLGPIRNDADRAKEWIEQLSDVFDARLAEIESELQAIKAEYEREIQRLQRRIEEEGEADEQGATA